MPQRHFLPNLPPAGPVELDGDLAHHIGRVLRMRPGEIVWLGDGRGGTARAVVATVTRTTVQLVVDAIRTEPPRRSVQLAFAPPRLSRAEWLFEHGTEVGVAVFHPLWTARTRPQGERPARWRRIALAAAGQCDRAWLPEVREAVEFAAFLASDLPKARYVAMPGAPSLLDLAVEPTDDVVLLVGPEGGLTDDEQRAALANGFVAAGLGPHTLRTETAAVVGAALLLAGSARDRARP